MVLPIVISFQYLMECNRQMQSTAVHLTGSVNHTERLFFIGAIIAR